MESITTSAIMTVKGAMLSDLSPEIQVCEKCGSEMEEIGEEKVYDELVYTPAKFHVRRHIAKTNKCPNCGDNPEKDAEHPDDIERCNIRRAAYPKPMIPGSYCSPELLCDIKIRHQSVRSILPKIVRKALKLSDYGEDLNEEY